ncbi:MULTISPECIES: LPS export ABC transporter permease LptG [Pseudoalteromonas]|uniref:LPS export ABC transporter permease LptG n=1 Tax=Pseudoalteromonas ruthenica TaxID=151081 RepID=A0A0F4PSF8_9GAMM|nr:MULTISPECIES: LPS export ABC transporter permease LptG [Pseudoalteromonas]KJY96506.1 lipopolysaccharide ABC transporter permease [Pseudoalteromonas ruthenica]KJY98377.1 lipopolysaccharide ABC transporter permease [Pseudoalteromonas ruthenica]MCF2862372.1 LPS export ABC transporter permease LptG [Pseudoalteromonas sp. CNAT2-18]MCG7544508.1 LPS export ABC transporter permease LptG [Pseudoalteromonas sp. MM17-2]MCG7557859.1 LPS export ABC transporter permease LptG [Pseudoalteromonas sp. CNAT2-|tara:strand:+ start:75278 stop:76342 length:1065 start_codon:yes stop_codon:yes gene_type:complete
MKTLDWYLGRSIMQTTGFALLVLVGISTLIKFIEQLKSVGRGSYDIMDALLYTLYTVPGDVVVFFPMAALIGGLTGLGALASNSELVVMQAAGMSRLQVIASVMKTAVVLALLMMAMAEWGVPKAEQTAKQLRSHAIYGGDVYSAKQGVWAKDGDVFVNIEDVDQQGQLNGVRMYHFDKDLELEKITFADRALYREGGWMLRKVKELHVDAAQIRESFAEEQFYDSQLTAEKLGVVSVKPETLSFKGLWSYLQYLQHNDQDTTAYELALWRKIMQPVSLAVMLLVALSFIFGPLRTVTMGARIVMGVVTGIAFHLTDRIFGPIVTVYQIPAFVGAVLPSMLFIIFSSYLLKRRN